MESLAQQTYAFLATILAGGTIGLLFDCYRVLRSLLAPKQLATAMTDLLYWIVVTPTVFALLLAGNWGELRFYVLLGLAVGLLLYFHTLSAAFVWLAIRVLRGTGQAVGSGLNIGARLLLSPIVFLQKTFQLTGFNRRSRPKWGKVAYRPRPPRLAMAWQRLSLSRIFNRFSG